MNRLSSLRSAFSACGHGGIKRISRIPSRCSFSLSMLQNLKGDSAKEKFSAPYALSFGNFIHSAGRKDFDMEMNSKPLNLGERNSRPMDYVRNSRPMDFVRGIIEEDASRFSGYGVEHNADVVHIKLLRNNTFVTVTDSKGNKKLGASSGWLKELKGGGPKVSRYAAEATTEYVGGLARKMGLKSVVVKVEGFTYFKKKRQAIMSFREGFSSSRSDKSPIVYIEDTTRKPHNGCRLPKKRRI